MLYLQNIKSLTLAAFIALGALVQCAQARAAQLETLTVAGGCFWCIEADFESVPGVTGAISGFTGGTLANPSYKQVKKGDTGHYESVQITFDPARVSRAQLLDMFFRAIDPTDAGGQFCDRGDNYRSAIFVSDPGEKALAEHARTSAQQALGQRIVTPVLPLAAFWPADAYHQDYATSSKIILTRYGPRRKSVAYKLYRKACNRDQRVHELWGSAAPFAGG